MKIDRPLWAAGTLLSPQQFQQQARWEAWNNECLAHLSLVHPWGVQAAAFDPEALQLGKLKAARLRLRMPDGTLIDTDHVDRLPPALELSRVLPESTQNAVLLLALPLEHANGNNCLFEDTQVDRPVRYRRDWRQVQDLYADEQQSIGVQEHALSLRLDTDDNADYLTCQIGRLMRDSQGAWTLDSVYVPPLLSFDAHPGLLAQLDNLLTQLDAVWQLQTEHQVVEQHVNFRAYHPRDIHAFLDGDVDQTRGAKSLYGEAYHYAEPYTELGDPLAHDEDLLSESGYFYARLRHERYLNNQTRLSGVSSSATLALAQVLKISGGAPQAFAPGAVITQLTTRAARDRSFEVSFEAIPYAETICFRPPLLEKPQIAGTVPARVTSTRAQDPYGHIDMEGRYKVSFLFDRDSWEPGEESLWLRLARPYAGDTHGLHLPLICGTEVAIAFEQGDPDRPYIAHALHDNKHKDHVTLDNRDHTRNVLRTPANNKLRMEDLRGQEHVKLSTEYGGKSQLNLGHLVDAQKEKRGEGFELRTDGWGAIRGGSGVFISADAQTKAQGQQLDMQAAINQLENALSLARSLSHAAQSAEVTPGDTDSQERLHQALKGLAQPGLLLHAPAGIGVVSPEATRRSVAQ